MRTLFIISIFGVLLFAKDVSTDSFKKLSMFQNPGVQVEKAYDHGSLYQVIFTSMTPQGPRRFTAFITKDKKTFIMGEAYDIESKKALKIPLDIAKIKKEADIVYGKGKNPYIVVTDPECRYCQMFQRQWEKIKDKYTLYVFMYPLSNHSQAQQMSFYVMSQKDSAAKAKALIGISQGKTDYLAYKPSEKQQTKFAKKFATNSMIADQLGVRGTPAVFDFEGNFVSWKELTD